MTTYKTAQTSGFAELQSYADVLAFLTAQRPGSPKSSAGKGPQLPFISAVPGINALFATLSAAASATPGASDEEWNPLSQRPHAPLPPPVGDELGGEITALKEAVDAFTTLSHEMMHVALWEPFFAGHWRPRAKRSFCEFSLMGEGYCFFFSDIIVSRAVRARLPDGEFALERQTPSNARFHPARAFKALRIESDAAILDIYLEGFSGGRTPLWKPRGTDNFVAALAAQTYDFYAGSLRYLDDLHSAIAAFGGLTEFWRRFCAIPGLPTFLAADVALQAGDAAPKGYFLKFFGAGLTLLAAMPPADLARLRARRMLQTRAYYALQVRWFLREERVLTRAGGMKRLAGLGTKVDSYLDGLAALLKALAKGEETGENLAALDATYERQVRVPMVGLEVWAGARWLIAPRRAGGFVSACGTAPSKAHDTKVALLRTVAFLVDELTRRMRESKSVAERTAILAAIQRTAGLGAAAGRGGAAAGKTAAKHLQTELATPLLRELWSVPLSAFDPVGNQYRELAFSYQ